MAKKVTITGSNFLRSTSDAWGGKNQTQSDQTVYGIPVPAGAEWGANKDEVERFIKAQLGSKFADFRTTEPDANNFIHILCFASVEDATSYDSDPVAGESLIVKNLTIPISTASIDSYVASLTTSRSTSLQYLVKDGDSFHIPLRFNATHIIAATSQQEPMSGNGTLIVERSANGTTWTQVYTRTIATSSESTGFPIDLDIKGMMNVGSLNYIRLRATFPYTDNEGTVKTMGSTPIVLNVNSVSLSLETTTAWHEPQVDPSALSLAYTVRGTVARTLHLKVTGSAGTYETTQALAAAQTSATFSLVEMSAYGLLTHGIKTCEAWLTAGDSAAGELESDHLIVRIMVVRKAVGPEVYLQPRLLISEMKSEVENFVQTRLLSYAVYSPALNDDGDIVNTGAAIPTTFILSNSANSIISVSQTTYASILTSPAPGNKYYLDMTVEIEQDGDTLSSFLHATREDGNVTKDFLLESTGSGSIYLRVDNTGGFQPTAGSTFLMNPKQRNNEEENPMTILNAKNNNAVVTSTWQNFRFGNEDGYVKDESGESCLRVPAGRLLNIAYNPLALLYRSPNASLNIELDICIRNVTNEDDPIVRLAEQVSGVWRGLRMLPIIGYMTTESWNADEESDFRWQEDVRTHIAINIVNAVYPNAHGDALTTAEKSAQSQGSFPLVRVFINGIINREFVYVPGATEFCTAAMSNGGMTFGQNGADIDIYGIRIWEGVALTPEQVLQDYISTLPNSDEKRRLKAENSIIDPNTGLIGLDYITGEGAVTGIKKNVLIWHGNEPYHENAHKGETGWLEVFRYDSEGNYLPEFSGTICKETKSIPQKAQGTTGKTYYYHNIQTKIQDSEGEITISPNDLHSSITAEWNGEYQWKDGDGNLTGEVGAWMIKGGYLGKNFPLATESALPYHGTASSIVVPDGWIDGNGKYRGVGYQVSANSSMFQKGVNKINYASSMQSHLIGINWLYNELHTAICGKNTMQLAVDGAVVAKHTEPFLFFTQAEGSSRAVFRGPCAFGAGKMDKPAWGYVKSAHPDFCMIEGADNDKQLTDMRVPWDDDAHGNDPAKVFYDPEEEAFYYRIAGGDAEKCIDFDGGKTDDAGYPSSSIISYIKAAWNFLYLHAPRIRHYDGTLSDFMVDAEYAQRTITAETTEQERERIELARSRVNTANKYWCHAEGGSAVGDYLLKRYDHADGEWVDAGLWNGTQYTQIDLRTYSMTAAAWNALTEAEKNQSEVANRAFVDAIVADARNNIGNYFKVSSLKFHYCFENHFIAGTDNCSKNTYYVLDPSTHLFELHQDDVDTTLATDNSGLQSKPYYIDRMHPYAGASASRVAMTGDVDNANILYEGYYNVLFDLVELMYEPTGELQAMMNTILSQMASLTGGLGSEESNSMSGVWRALNRYIFDIQRYFPATVFNEAARIRYELPELIGYLSDIRSIHPIKQSMGDQLQAELQFMKRRLVYMASYAAFGEFAPTSLRSGLTGLAEATESFGMQKFALPGSTSPSAYTFHLVPHQWIYPTGGRETSNLIDPHVRVAPGEEFVLDINPGQASDLGVNVFGLNYYRELGNIGDMVANNGQANFTLNGRRLTKFECVPTVFYTAENLPAFRVNNIIIGSATRLKEFNVRGAVIGTGTLNLSTLTLCETIDLRETSISQVRVPETSTIETLQLPSTLTALNLEAQPMLSTLTMSGYAALTQVVVTGSPLLSQSMRAHVLAMKEAGAAITTLKLTGIDWLTQPIDGDVVRWMIAVGDNGICELTGAVATVTGQQGILYYEDVVKLITRYGNIRSTENSLFVRFSGTSIAVSNMSIEGKKYINTDEESEGYDLDMSDCFNDLAIAVASGNDVAVAYNSSGNPVPNVVWELTDASASTYAEFQDPYSPVLHLKMKGGSVQNIILNVRATLTNTSGETRIVEKVIGLWNRIPEVGDYAWTDGQFDNTNDASKKLAGVVIRKTEVVEDGKTIYDLDILAAADASFPTSNVSGGYESSWGLYPTAAEGFSDAKTNGEYDDPVLNAVLQAVQSWVKPADVNYAISSTFKTDVFDTPLANISGDAYIRKDAAAVSAAGNGIAMQDATNVENKGYAIYSQSYMNNFQTKEENAVLMSYADAVLKAALAALNITQEDFPEGCTSEGIPTTTQAMYALAEIMVQKAVDAGATKPARYRELLFPAVRRCNVWSPADMSGQAVEDSKLHDSYKRGKWRLPSSGLMARIFNFMANSRAGYNTNGAPSATYANEDVALEAQLPLFANAIARGRSIPISSGSSHWSSPEGYRNSARNVNFGLGYTSSSSKCYGSVVRPVTAFKFVP